ncbi:unnamed protein product, partial [Symbiodinium necroappetens]
MMIEMASSNRMSSTQWPIALPIQTRTSCGSSWTATGQATSACETSARTMLSSGLNFELSAAQTSRA